MGSQKIDPAIAFLTALSLSLLVFSGTVAAEEAPVPTVLRFTVELKITLEDANSGHLEFYMGNSPPEDLTLIKGDPPRSIDPIPDITLENAHDNLTKAWTTGESLFRALLNSSGELRMFGSETRYHMDGLRFGMSINASFSYPAGELTREYHYLTFLEPIRPPKLDRTQPRSVLRYEEAIARLSATDVRIEIVPPPGSNMDLEWAGTHHRRTPSGERAELESDMLGFIDNGHGLLVSEEALLSTRATLFFAMASVLVGLSVAAWASYRKRFVRWGIAFPLGAIVLSPLPLFFYIRPYLNPYGLFDGGLFMASFLFLAYCTGIHFCPRGERSTEVSEVDAPMPEPDYEMPKVIYVDRPRHIVVRAEKVSERTDPYSVLGVDRSATKAEIEEAYRRLVLRYHPDKVQKAPEWVGEAAQERIHMLNEAYEEISKDRGRR